MSDAEKAAAFDTLIDALANRWADGRWSWFPLSPCGGPMRATKEEVVPDLVEWANKVAARNAKRFARSAS